MHIFYLVNSKNKTTTNTINNFSIKDDRKWLNNNNNNNIINNNGSSSDDNDSNNNNTNNEINNNDSNGKNRIDQFPHQVGGHSAMLSIEGNICKPLINRELQFYEFSQLRDNIHSFFISPFIANFYGVVDVLKSKNEELSPQQPTALPHQSQSQSQSQQQQYNNNIINNNNKNKIKDCKHPSGTQQSYIVLQDLTVDYKKPCIVDIKIGTRQRGAICSSTTSTSHGIRVCGMKIFSPELGNIVFDRYYGRTLNSETLEDSLLNFFTSNILNSSNSSTNNNNNNNNNISIDFHLQRITLIESIIQKLSQIECILSNKNGRFPFKIYSSSLLIIYEGEHGDNEIIQQKQSNNSNNNEINNNPFNDSSSSSSAASSCTTTPSQSPTTNLLNSDSIQSSTDSFIDNNNNNVNNNSGNIQRNINLILDPSKTTNRNSGGGSSSSSSADITMVEDMEDGFQSFASEEDVDESYISSDLDSDSDEIDSTRCLNSNRSSRSNSKSKSTKSSQLIKNDVKMIDFAHAIPLHEKDAEEDDGYLFGIQNLQLLLFKIKSRLLFSLNIQQLAKNNSINNIINNSNNNNDIIISEPSSPNSSFSSLSNSSTIIDSNNNNNNSNNYDNESVSSNFDYSFMKMFNNQNYQQSQPQQL